MSPPQRLPLTTLSKRQPPSLPFSILSLLSSYYLLLPDISHSIYLLLLFGLPLAQEFTFYGSRNLACICCCSSSTCNCTWHRINITGTQYLLYAWMDGWMDEYVYLFIAWSETNGSKFYVLENIFPEKR